MTLIGFFANGGYTIWIQCERSITLGRAGWFNHYPNVPDAETKN